MQELKAALLEEIRGAQEQADEAGEDQLKLVHALTRMTDLITALDRARYEVGANVKELIVKALKAGVDPRDLYGRPFSNTLVREIAKEHGVKLPGPGRRPRGGLLGAETWAS